MKLIQWTWCRPTGVVTTENGKFCECNAVSIKRRCRRNGQNRTRGRRGPDRQWRRTGRREPYGWWCRGRNGVGLASGCRPSRARSPRGFPCCCCFSCRGSSWSVCAERHTGCHRATCDIEWRSRCQRIGRGGGAEGWRRS